MAPEEYSFSLTGGDGSRLHGFCRSFLPPRAKLNSLRYPQVLCIITEHLWLTFYFKVLQVLEALLKQSDLLNGPAHASLPYASPASQFLETLSIASTGKLCPGEVLRVPLPRTPTPVNVSPPRRIGADFQSSSQPALRSTEQWLELEVPPDAGNGAENAGLPLARLLWHLPPPALVSLIEALLLERRILMVAQERDTVSAAVHAAAALLHPLRWQHIYLPLLPLALKDYLSAPMPFLMGVHAPNLFKSTLRSAAMEEIVVVDLDRGTTTAAAGGASSHGIGAAGQRVGGSALPWAAQLESALALLRETLRSPVEYESTPVIAALMQEYMVKLLGRYREFVERDVPGSPGPAAVPEANGAGPRSRHQDDGYIRAHGYRFNHAAFVASFRSAKTRAFLEQLRQSQCYEVFFNDRLLVASSGQPFADQFEVAAAAVKRGKISQTIASASAKGVSRVNAIIQRTSKAVKSMRHGSAEQTSPPERHQSSRPARPMTPPAVVIPANHQFLSEDESSSGSDSEAATAADSRRTPAQARAQTRPGMPSIQSASGGPRPGAGALSAPPSDSPGGPPSSNGSRAAAAASYYMPVVDTPSLLDLATEVPAPGASNGNLMPSLLDMDWALPGAGVAMHRAASNGAQAAPCQQADGSEAGTSDAERPRNGWASIGEVLGAPLTGDAPAQPPTAVPDSVPQMESRASPSTPHRMSGPLPHRSTDPLAALDPFGDIAGWASPDSIATPGNQSRTASQALQGSPLRSSRSAAEPLQPLACSFSHSPAASSPLTSTTRAGSSPYKLPDAFSSLAGLSLGGSGSSPLHSSANPARALFEVEVDGGSRQASAEPLNFKAVASPATPVANGAAANGASQGLADSKLAFASAQAEPFATAGTRIDRLKGAAEQNRVLPWIEVDSVHAPREMRHSESWTEWTTGAPASAALEAQRTSSMQQNPQGLGNCAASLPAAPPVSLLDL
ncbi:probable DENN domain-containing protein 1C at N-terminal half [Coccomyxa sp. Obi]|nr:probable DENN domain-containing protein 1C at N-terminal half [Coccomyxa sp. Obi]